MQITSSFLEWLSLGENKNLLGSGEGWGNPFVHRQVVGGGRKAVASQSLKLYRFI